MANSLAMAYAGEVWSPGGDTRVDSLGNEDSITGTGAADSLEATLAAADVAPILQGIETLDVDFIGVSAGQSFGSRRLEWCGEYHCWSYHKQHQRNY